MAEVALNKDGKPRKKGSGKTRGAGCYAKIPWSDLKKFIGSEVSIPVSRVWLRNLNADLDKASEENERQHFMVERNDGLKIGFTQIAGLVARRIVPFVKPGDMVATGQRIGLIRFGSRVDVFLPDDIIPQVILGQRSIAGETVIGRIGGVPVTGIAQ